MTPEISEKMIALADRLNLPADHELRVRAREFTEACAAKDVNARRLLGAWARARKAWCAVTGEPLV